VATRADDTVLAAAYAEHAAEVYRVIYAVVTNRSAAEDLTHDTYVKAQENLVRFDRSRPIRPWLLTIALRTALDYERRERLRRVLMRRNSAATQADSHSAAVDLRLDTDAALRALEPKQRAIVVARHYCDLSYEQIAQLLSTTPQNVGVVLHRSIAQLRTALSRLDVDEGSRGTRGANPDRGTVK
jgi:RNA polymerase sigma-70 factor (ECF subfamily)